MVKFINSFSLKGQMVFKRASALIRDALLGERPTLTAFLDRYIADCEAGRRLHQKKKTPLADGTINAFRNLRVALKDYEADRGRQIGFRDVNQRFFDDFVFFLFHERTYKNGKSRITKPNTCFTYVTALKTLMAVSRHEGLHQNNSYELGSFSIERSSPDNIYLTEDQVHDLFITDFTDTETLKKMVDRIEDPSEQATMRQRLFEARQRKRHRQFYQEYKDLFVIGCLTGQRHSDYKRICTDMIKETDGFKFIDIIQKKTDKRVLIPLDSRVEDILRRHGGHIKPHLINSMTKGLKDIGLLMGWTQNAGIKEYVGARKQLSTKRFCDLLTTHTARRTWATNAYKNHVPLSSIMAVTGHGSESMLRKYLKLNEEEKGLSAARDLQDSGFMNLAK